MKNLFISFCILVIGAFSYQAQAQNIIQGNVVDVNGQLVVGAEVQIILEACNMFVDSIFTSPNGAFQADLGTCNEGDALISITCPNSSNSITQVIQLDPSTNTINLTFTIDCSNIPPVDSCFVAFEYDIDTINQVITLYGFADSSTGSNNGTYIWWSPDLPTLVPITGNPVDFPLVSGTSNGELTICVDYDDGQVACTFCESVQINNNVTPTDCWVGYEYYIGTNDEVVLEAFVQGSATNYSFNWSDGNGALIATGSTTSIPQNNSGQYYICVDAIGDDGSTCQQCNSFFLVPDSTFCQVTFDYGLDASGENIYVTVTPAFGTAPYAYEWYSDIDSISTTNTNTYTFEAQGWGQYFVCVNIIDANGDMCEYCDVILVDDWSGGGDGCLDWSLIDLTAACPEVIDPVCGCDGVTYENSCIAENCFGIMEWTAGPCSGGTFPTDPVDSTFVCDDIFSEIYYAGGIDQNGDFNVFFFANGNADSYIWSIDGVEFTGEFATYTFSGTDSLSAHTICLISYAQNLGCVDTLCETIVLDITPNGFIDGIIVDAGDGLGGVGEVNRVTSPQGNPLEGVLVELLDYAGNILATTTTDAQGAYSFQSLLFGDYFVHVNIPNTTHEPHLVTLNPVVQTMAETNFEVVGNEILLGNEEVSFAAGITLSPNPTSGNLSLSMDMTQDVELTIRITDLLGKSIYTANHQMNVGTQTLEFDLSTAPIGIYLVSIQGGNTVFTQKVIKN